ncbi:MAG: hypothetical protein IT245_03485 [Bacteroidia bacterium]|nr:hypothetical protein [Bacteroidia bacterium]
MLFKLIINIFIVYGIWQFIKLLTSVNKTQEKFRQKMDDMGREQDTRSTVSSKKKGEGDGEYIDYEEIK